jgi:fibronectin type 3 domain-containing protein
VGDRLVIEFTIPPLTTDNLGLRLAGVELRASTTDPGAAVEPWASSADQIDVQASEPGPVRREVASASWSGKPLWLAVRVGSHKKKWSEWSNVTGIEVVPEVRRPEGLRAENTPQGTRLSWRFAEERAGRQVRVLRKAPGEPQFTAAATAPGTEWLDPVVTLGQTYEYAVQAVVGEAQSQATDPIRFTPEDRFAPAPPAGLTALAGLSSIELAWEPGPEPDLTGYRVYRAEGDADLRPLGEPVATPSYRDKEARSGTRYRYAISAIDQRGNESQPCAAVIIEAPR